MITKQQYQAALEIVLKYEQQQLDSAEADKRKVRLSAWGLEMQGQSKKNLRGVIIEKVLAGVDDYTVKVKWDGIKRAEWMHEHQIEHIK